MRNCPLCASTVAFTYMKPTAWNNRHGVELKKCSDCRFVFSAESLCDYVSVGNTHEQRDAQALLKLAQQQRLPQLMDEIVAKTRLQHGTTLDFGAGIGLASLCLQNKGFTTYAIEASERFLLAHKKFSIISAPSLAALPVKKNSFDLVLLKDVLEHVDNPVHLLQETVSYVKPSGYFYIRVPYVYHYNFHWSIDTKSHINHFTPAHLTELMARNQMKKVDFVGVYDISTQAGKLYNAIFWKMRHAIPLYHQISLLYQKI